MAEATSTSNPSNIPSTADRNNPFPGLRPFKIQESHLFFGREGQSDEVLLKLSKHRFVGVIGPSGSGKSSFVYCGVLPILYGGFLTDASPNWEVVVTRPGAGPIENLAESLLSKDPEYNSAQPEDQKIKRTIITTLLRSSSIGLVEAVLQLKRAEDKNFLILVDQFEELFRFKDSADTGAVNETLAFVNLLMEAVDYPDAPIYIGITMRSDFIGDCAQFPDLTKKINDSHYLIPQMTREQKRKAITGPVAVGGAEITQRLTQQLLNDLGDNPDQLPILQHALMRTWSFWSKQQSNEPLDIRHYEAIGTMSEALSMHANEAYDELTDDQKEICESLFKAITEKRGENFGIRRPTRLGEIAAIADVPEEEVVAVIDEFREPGRSLLTPSYTVPLDSKSMIDISHESLMRIWVRLKNWVDDEAEAVQMYLRLSEASAMYQVGKAGLWRPPDLQLALNWKAKHKPTLVWGQRYHPAFERTMIFLEYSRKEFETEQRIKELQQKRRLRNARIVALVLATATVISIGFLMYAFYQQIEAEEARQQAEDNLIIANEQRKRAENQKEKADSLALVAQIERDSALAARQAAIIAQRSAEENFQRAEREKERAEKQQQLALDNAEKARIARDEAIENEKIAQEQRKEAETQKERADRLRYQSLAQSMALKSTQLRKEQKELKGLLAQQAYIFNSTYGGDKYDNDIYNGLYYAIKTLGDPLVESLGGHEKGIRALTSFSTGNLIFSGDTQGKILKWSLQGESRVADTLAPSRSSKHVIRAMAVSSNNQTLVAGGNFASVNGESFVEILNTTKPADIKRLSGFSGAIWDVIMAPDDRGFYVLDSEGQSIKYSDFNTVKEIATSQARINDIALSADGKYLVGAGNDGKVYLLEINNNDHFAEIYNNGVKILSIAISQDNTVAFGDEEGLVKRFVLFSNASLVRLVGHSSPIEHVTFSSDGRFIASASRDKTVRLWNRNDLNAQPITLDDHPDWVFSIAFSPNNEQILAGTKEDVVRAWPTSIQVMANKICAKLDGNMTQDEWDTYVGETVDYELTCDAYPKGE
ncbi:MAG: High-affnity carbon uptake protein Hat/HatR [Fulvivirga sp.]|nr:High-affnity carbon uptake protein Hat/HatR [Fulvivirga sp.]